MLFSADRRIRNASIEEMSESTSRWWQGEALQPGDEFGSLGSAKDIPFGVLLRRAIDQEFGSQKAFAVQMGLSEGRVSQIIGDRAEIKPGTLDQILQAFPSFAHKDALYKAWLQTFTSPPEGLLESATAEWDQDFVDQADGVLACGKARFALRVLNHICSRGFDGELTYRALEKQINVLLLLGRYAEAARVAGKIYYIGRHHGDANWIVRGHWLEFLAASASPFASLKEVYGLWGRARSVLTTWTPTSLSAKAEKRHVGFGIMRDAAIAFDRLQSGTGHSNELLSAMDAQLKKVNDDWAPHARALVLEVQGRLAFSLGQLSRAEDLLDEALGSGSIVSYDHQLKTAILHGRILCARKGFEQARSIFDWAIERSMDICSLHHVQRIDRLVVALP